MLTAGASSPPPAVYRSPVSEVEENEENWEHTEKYQICLRESTNTRSTSRPYCLIVKLLSLVTCLACLNFHFLSSLNCFLSWCRKKRIHSSDSGHVSRFLSTCLYLLLSWEQNENVVDVLLWSRVTRVTLFLKTSETDKDISPCEFLASREWLCTPGELQKQRWCRQSPNILLLWDPPPAIIYE